MPELPDVETFKKTAEKAVGASVENVETKDAEFLDTTQARLSRHIKGQKFKKTLRRGKYLFLGTDSKYSVVMHFGMTGVLHYQKQDDETPSYAKCIFELDNGHRLIYVSKRKLGTVDITDAVDDYINEQDLGPDALEISKSEFIEKIKKSQASVKGFFMNQSTIAGIGNVYADEILFQACIHPKQKTKELTDKQQEALYHKMHKVLKKAIEKQADVSKLPDSYLLPRRKEGQKCPQGKGKVAKISVSGRAGYYCPECQKLEKSTGK